MRFVKQRDNYSCGPIGVINALKWAGFPLSYQKHFRKIKKKCKTTRSWGTLVDRISVALDWYVGQIEYEREQLVTYRRLLRHLKQGGSAILEYWFKEDNGTWDGHYVFIFMEDGEFVVTNPLEGGTKEVVSADYIKAALRCRKYRVTGSPSAWLIRKVSG